MPSQWVKVIFGHLGLRNPWTDSLEIWHVWLCPQSDLTCKIWWPPKIGVGWAIMGIWVKLYLRVLFWFFQCVHSLPWEAWIFTQCIQKRVSVVVCSFGVGLPKGSNLPFSNKIFFNGPNNKVMILHGR